MQIVIDQYVSNFVSDRGAAYDLDGLYALFIGSIESELILKVLQSCDGNKARAAKVLGLHRNTLTQKIRALSDIKPKTVKALSRKKLTKAKLRRP